MPVCRPTWSRRRWLAAATALPLAGCAGPAPWLRVAFNDWAPYLFYEVAAADESARVHTTEMPSSTDSLMALHTAEVDAAGLTLDEFLLARSEGLGLVAVAVCNVSDGADVLIARPGVPSLAALRGLRIGVEGGAVGALLLDGALRAARLEPTDVVIVDLARSGQVAAWRAGTVDAVVTFGRAADELLAMGGQALFDSRRMPGAIVDVLAVREDALPRVEGPLRRWLAGYFEMQGRWLAGDREAARQRLAERLGIPTERVDGLFEGLALVPADQQLDWLAGMRLRRAAERLSETMLARGLLMQQPSLERLGDARWTPTGGS